MGGVNHKCLGLGLEKATPGSPQGGLSPIGGVRPAGGLLVWGDQGGKAISSVPPCCISPAGRDSDGDGEQAPCRSTGVIHSSKHSPCLQAESVWGRSLLFEGRFPSWGSLGHLILLSQLCSRCVPELPVLAAWLRLHRGGHAASPWTPPGHTCLGGEVTSLAPLSPPSPPPVTPPSWR